MRGTTRLVATGCLAWTGVLGCSYNLGGIPCITDNDCPSGQSCHLSGHCGSPVQGLGISPPYASLPLGQTVPFTALAGYADGTSEEVTPQATWQSSAPGVASISNGVATALAKGMTTISASFNGFAATASLSFGDATLSALSVTPANPTLAPGTTLQFQATGLMSDGTTLELTTPPTMWRIAVWRRSLKPWLCAIHWAMENGPKPFGSLA